MSKLVEDILNNNFLASSGEENQNNTVYDETQPSDSVGQTNDAIITQTANNTGNQSKYPAPSVDDISKIKNGMNVLNWIGNAYKPDPLNENALSRNRMLGSIGDGIKLLGQMYGAGRGAHIRNNNPNDSLTNYFLNEEKRLRNIYEKDMDEYKRIRLNLALEGLRRQQSLDDRKDLWKRQDERYIITDALNELKAMNDKAYKDAQLTNKEKELALRAANNANMAGYRSGMLGVARQNAKSNETRANKTNQSDIGNQKGYLRFYDSKTGDWYVINEDQKWKPNFSKIFKIIEPDLESKDISYARKKVLGLKPSEKEDYLKQYMNDNPEAMKYLKEISDYVIPGNVNDEPQSSQPSQPAYQWGMPPFRPNTVTTNQTNQSNINNDPLGLGF